MPTISVKVQNSATDQVVQDIVNAANAQTPPHVIPRAMITRNSSGKVISVDVGLPFDLASSDLANAKAAIDATSGVASTAAYPVTVVLDFSTLTPGAAAPAEIGVVPGKLSLVSTGGTLTCATPEESFGGTGSAIKMEGTGYLSLAPANNGLTEISAYEISGKMKRFGSAGNAVLYMPTGGVPRAAACNGNGSNWLVQLYDPTGFPGLWGGSDAGVVSTSYIDFKYRKDTAGISSVEINGVSLSYNNGFSFSFNDPMIWQFNNPVGSGIILDNLSVSILASS